MAVNSFGFGGANAHIILESERVGKRVRTEYAIPRLVLASGRTEDAVSHLLEHAAKHAKDAELHGLLDAIHARNIPGHGYRGYGLLLNEMQTEIVVSELLNMIHYCSTIIIFLSSFYFRMQPATLRRKIVLLE